MSPNASSLDSSPPSFTPPSKAWWKSCTVYQIYPISFFDSNGDGIGDLNGIHAKLDYLKDLGVDVVWLSPIYRSPLADMGYDISDYRDIDPRYGTLEDWDRLLQGVHERGMKLVMDLVVNHSSDEHEWFIQSKSSKEKNNPKRDWYIWRPPKIDAATGKRHPPNNWRSVFHGSAWDYDEKTDEYYLHLYVSKQPDLNWENPEVRKAVWDIMFFWIERGCDGFRMDVINLISKVDGLPDAPITEPDAEYQLDPALWANGPRVHEYLKEMNSTVLSKHDVITVGETPFTHDPSTLAEYVLPENKELQMIFQFDLMAIDSPLGGEHKPMIHRDWKLSEFRAILGRWQRFRYDQGFWNATFLENHDHSRSVSRFGNDSSQWRELSAKMLALMQITLCGTQYLYQGQELGLKNFPRSWGIEEYKDVASQNYWKQVLDERRKETGDADPDMSEIMDNFQRKARDHSRTPMQWDATVHGGFTSGTPWMRVNDDYETSNVDVQSTNENSVLNFWKKALKVRKDHEVLIYGNFIDLDPENEQVLVYTRTLGEVTALVVLNFKETEITYSLGSHGARTWREDAKYVIGNYPPGPPGAGDVALNGDVVVLRGFEGRLYI